LESGVEAAAVSVAFRSIGCRTNQEELFALKADFAARGCRIVEEFEDADVIVVNTCSVTSLTESKVGRFIRSLARIAPNARILVAGCFAQQHGEAILEFPGVQWVVGNGDKRRIPSIVFDGGGGAYLSDVNGGGAVFWESGDSIPKPGISGRTRFLLKIQEGCDFQCAYCIVPSLRGASRSAPRSQLLDSFKSAVDAGYREIVLTGTHIGQYSDDGGGLESLLEGFLKVNGDYRIRLSSIDPRDLTDGIIALAGEESRVCDHLHVSVQSLCADVLRSMDRPHDLLDELVQRLYTFRQKYPTAALGADFVVGHPGETERMFETTLRGAEQAGFTYAHIFRYSARKGTKAAQMPGQIRESVKKARSGVLKEVVQKSREKFLSLLFNSAPLYIIVESEYPARGVSGNYIKVEIPGLRAPQNSRLRVTLTGEVREEYCLGV
jgi:threonylcarbamoyladenosine tRNA methylthiotransferase MtaB